VNVGTFRQDVFAWVRRSVSDNRWSRRISRSPGRAPSTSCSWRPSTAAFTHSTQYRDAPVASRSFINVAAGITPRAADLNFGHLAEISITFDTGHRPGERHAVRRRETKQSGNATYSPTPSTSRAGEQVAPVLIQPPSARSAPLLRLAASDTQQRPAWCCPTRGVRRLRFQPRCLPMGRVAFWVTTRHLGAGGSCSAPPRGYPGCGWVIG